MLETNAENISINKSETDNFNFQEIINNSKTEELDKLYDQQTEEKEEEQEPEQQEVQQEATQSISFLRWFNPFSQNIKKISTTTTTTTTKATTTSTAANSKSNSTNDEYKGVQGLKQFWNNQIISSKDPADKQKSATLGCTYNSNRSSSSSSGDTNPSSPIKNITLVTIDQTKRSLSYRSNFGGSIEDHTDVDNFYKYKTADTKKRSSLTHSVSDVKHNRIITDQPVKASPIRNSSCGIHFPPVETTPTGGKIHWAKRQDIFMSRKLKSKSLDSEKSQRNNNKTHLKFTNENFITQEDNDQYTTKSHCNKTENNFDYTGDNIIKEPTTTIVIKSSETMAIPKADKTDSGRSQSGSMNSLSSDSPARKNNSTVAARKYSFKTHTKNYHAPRKMAATATHGSKVAALTNRFNQLIQQDSALLEEIKKNNGIIISRAGHIYKIKDGGGNGTGTGTGGGGVNGTGDKKKNNKRNSSDDDSSTSGNNKKRSNIKRKSSFNHRSHGTVKAAIEVFETKRSVGDTNESVTMKNVTVEVQKPKVPSKSEQVLQRTKEIAIKNNQKKTRLISTKSIKLKDDSNIETPLKIIEEIQEEDKQLSENIINKQSSSIIIQETDIPETNKTEIPGEILSAKMEGEEEVGNLTTTTTANNSDVAESGVETKKSKYARIYEKFRFRALNKKPVVIDKSPPDKMISPPPSLLPDTDKEVKPDQKILDALDTVNKKLEHLSKSTNDINEDHNNEEDRLYQEMKANMKPNESFLFRMNSKNLSNSANAFDIDVEIELTEAVNVSLINKTQSMDETKFPSIFDNQISNDIKTYTDIFENTDKLLNQFKLSKDFYEETTTKKNENNPSKEAEKKQAGQEEEGVVVGVQNNKTPISFHYQSVNASTKESNNEEVSTCDGNIIYQTVDEVTNITNNSNNNKYNNNNNNNNNSTRDCDSVNSYESFENYESVEDDDDDTTTNLNNVNSELIENSYEICDPPEPPPPRKNETAGVVVDNNNKITASGSPISGTEPALPEPKRIIPKSSQLDVGGSSIGGGKVPPPRPPKSPNIDHGGSGGGSSIIDRTKLPDIPKDHQHKILPDSSHRTEDYDEENDYDDENIYDTIKNGETTSHCYESISNRSIQIQKCLDTISMVSNGYESINSIRRCGTGGAGVSHLRHSDSISTLSSDQKTNSLYGMTVHQTNENLSDNSDEWIDMSDTEGDKHQFIVVRERAKCHRSPDWSKRVRDRRLNQQVVDNKNDDDSDHFYEPLYTSEYSDQDLLSRVPPENLSKESHKNLVPSTIMPDTHNGNCYSDDYDSFDTDEETDDDVKKNDSGVDISNVRLPDPPPPTNQVYAFVKKFKNFSSISKSLSKISKRKGSSSAPQSPEAPSKPYENTQFYVSHEYQNTNFTEDQSQKTNSKQKTPKTAKKSLKKTSVSDDPYENTEFHTPRTPSIVTTPTNDTSSNQSPLNSSDKSIVESGTVSSDIMNRKKSKSNKSFKSKFRKSLPGTDGNLNQRSEYAATRSTFYISDSVDLDSGIFEKTPQSEPNISTTTTATSEAEIDKKSLTSTRKSKRSTHSPDLNRRRTTLGIRPNNPPPPPPVDKKGKQKRSTSSSWYAECGVFKMNTINDELLLKEKKRERSSSTSWYAEAGLYQTSGASVASSSGSSGVSTGGEGGPGDENSHSMFSNEPLYQIYSAAKLESISCDDHESTDGYEEIGTLNKPEEERKPTRPTALQLVGPKQGPSRTLWSEIPEVINSEILSTLTQTEKRRQEAKFEILTSEASYLKSLNLLKTHFMNHPAFRDTSILNSSDRKTLFSYIVPVQECSDRLLCDLENCWQDNIMLLGLSKSIYKHAEKYFHVYVSFCEHQGKMDRTLRKLKEAKGVFSQTLESIEADPVCCSLNLHSFLMLPMQRITRLPLLIDAVFSKIKQDDDEYEDWKMTLSILSKIVAQCNEAANRCEQAYEIERISRQIEFPSSIRSLAIAPAGVLAPGKRPRTLVRKGELLHLIWRGDDGKLTFGKKFIKCNIYAFLFTDLLVLTKRKGEEQFMVFDYCPRSMLTVSSGEVIPQLPTKEVAQAGKNLILMTLLENHEGKTIEMILSCPSVSEQQRWLQATAPPESENPEEKLYEQWDCPQVVAKHSYNATEPDLLSLERGDVVNVSRKMTDGWYQGERIRDGAIGWFPGSFTEEVNSPHVRARNLKQRYRLLTLTASYLELKKKK